MRHLNQFYNNLHGEIIKLCHSMKLKLHDNKTGNKDFDNYQRVSILILYIKSGKSLRQFLFDFHETKWKFWLQLKRFPGKSTIHDWLKNFSTTFIRKLFEFTVKDLKPSIAAIDGSGVDTYYKSSYYQKRLTDFGFRKPKSPWHKLDIIVDVKSKEKYILDFSFLLRSKHDSKVAWQLFKRSKLKNIDILADKGYYWFDLFYLAKIKNNKLIVPPKNYGTKCLHNRSKRRNFHNCYYKNEDKYTLRNNVEGVFSSLKRVQGLRLRSKLSFMKKRELAWNIVWYNIRKKISLRLIFFLKIINFYRKFEDFFLLKIYPTKITHKF